MAAPVDQLIKLLNMFSSEYDGEVLNAARMAHAKLVAEDWSWEGLFANGSAMALSEEQVQRIYAAGVARGEAQGYQRAMADAQSLAPPQARPQSIEVADDIEWISPVLDAAEKAETAGHLDAFEIDFSQSMRDKLSRFGRGTYLSQRQFDSLKRLEHSLRRRGYL
jgi:hypothetical protein